MIDAGAVTIDGQLVTKASATINEAVPHEVELRPVFRYVSRGGTKLEEALRRFSVSVNGKKAVDVGASTGGFTDCLLQHGARRVIALDAGVGQLYPDLRSDPRVLCVEQFNARNMTEETTEGLCDVAVTDVSFISQTYLHAPIASVLRDGGIFISLIKPQFEAGRSALGKNGVVRSSAYRFLAVKRVLHSAEECGLDCRGLIPSPIQGGDGNIEYLALFVKAPTIKPLIDDKMIKRITL